MGVVVAFGLGDGLNVGVVVAVDVADEVLVVFVVFPVHPAINTVANTIVIMNITKSYFFIFIPSFGENFPVVKGYPRG